MSAALSKDKLEQLETAVDRIVKARHIDEGLFDRSPATDDIIRTMGLAEQDPEKSYKLYYGNIQKALRKFLPPRKKTSQVARELVAILLSHKEKENVNSGRRGADSRMARTDDMVNLIDVLSEWSETPEDIMRLIYILLNKNKELGYVPNDRRISDYL